MRHRFAATRRRFIASAAATAVVGWAPRIAFAAEPLKIGLIIPLTGPFASTGRQPRSKRTHAPPLFSTG